MESTIGVTDSERTKLQQSIGGGRTTVLPRRAPGSGVAPFEMKPQPRFEPLGLLGEGGIGRVSLEHDHDITRSVAVKRLRTDRKSPDALARFAEEVQIVGQLEHPNIIPIHDVGVDEAGEHYLVMKHIQGETLETILEKLQAGDPAVVARFTMSYRAQVFASVLEAITYAHEKGIVHRDLKPANIMVGPHGEVTVMDWGVAKRLADPSDGRDEALRSTMSDRLLETQDGTIVGTPYYMSPEQAAAKNDGIGVQSDVWSLGMILFELMTLRHPFDGKSTVREVLAELIANGVHHGEIGTRFIDASAPMEFAFVVMKALEHKPADRYATVAEMLAHVRRLQNGDVRVQCHVTLFKRVAYGAVHWVDRHTKIYTSLLALGLLGTVSAIVFAVVRLLGK